MFAKPLLITIERFLRFHQKSFSNCRVYEKAVLSGSRVIVLFFTGPEDELSSQTELIVLLCRWRVIDTTVLAHKQSAAADKEEVQ